MKADPIGRPTAGRAVSPARHHRRLEAATEFLFGSILSTTTAGASDNDSLAVVETNKGLPPRLKEVRPMNCRWVDLCYQSVNVFAL
jgi:hypothetical protein